MTPTREPLRVALYARVSTDHQTTANQLCELQEVAGRHGWAVIGECVDHGQSGTIAPKARPKLAALMSAVARREVDLVAAWSVDRLGRSLQDLLALLGELHAKGVDLYLHQQGLDRRTPGGKALFQMLGVFAEFERTMIVEHVRAGLARARQGNSIGTGNRPPARRSGEGTPHPRATPEGARDAQDRARGRGRGKRSSARSDQAVGVDPNFEEREDGSSIEGQSNNGVDRAGEQRGERLVWIGGASFAASDDG